MEKDGEERQLKKGKKYSTEQRTLLEKEFELASFLTKESKIRVMEATGLQGDQVTGWFQKRRSARQAAALKEKGQPSASETTPPLTPEDARHHRATGVHSADPPDRPTRAAEAFHHQPYGNTSDSPASRSELRQRIPTSDAGGSGSEDSADPDSGAASQTGLKASLESHLANTPNALAALRSFQAVQGPGSVRHTPLSGANEERAGSPAGGGGFKIQPPPLPKSSGTDLPQPQPQRASPIPLTQEQRLGALEAAFQQGSDPTDTSRRDLAGMLGVTPEVVTTWFMQRRRKAAKELSGAAPTPPPAARPSASPPAANPPSATPHSAAQSSAAQSSAATQRSATQPSAVPPSAAPPVSAPPSAPRPSASQPFTTPPTSAPLVAATPPAAPPAATSNFAHPTSAIPSAKASAPMSHPAVSPFRRQRVVLGMPATNPFLLHPPTMAQVQAAAAASAVAYADLMEAQPQRMQGGGGDGRAPMDVSSGTF